MLIKIPGPPLDPDAPHKRALCYGPPRCTKPQDAPPCDGCYIFWSDDPRTEEELRADMARST